MTQHAAATGVSAAAAAGAVSLFAVVYNLHVWAQVGVTQLCTGAIKCQVKRRRFISARESQAGVYGNKQIRIMHHINSGN